MRALVWQAPRRLEVSHVADPLADAHTVVVAVRRVGICGSDLTAYRGAMGTEHPGAIRGHEFAGVVHSSAHPQWPPGSRVAVNPVVTCLWCDECRTGRTSACPSLEILGVHRPGGFADLVAVPVTQLYRVPDVMPWESAASVEPLAQACHDVQRAAELGPLGHCLVMGAGSIGLAIIHALRLAAADAITVVDTDPRRHPAARAAGATLALDSVEHTAAGWFDTVFDVVGSAATRRAAVSSARAGGTVIAVGLGSDETSVPWFDVVRREITIRGSNALTPDDFSVALQWLTLAAVPPLDHVRHVSLSEAPTAFEELSDRRLPEKVFIAFDDADQSEHLIPQELR